MCKDNDDERRITAQIQLLQLEYMKAIMDSVDRIATALEAQVAIGNETLDRIKAIH